MPFWLYCNIAMILYGIAWCSAISALHTLATAAVALYPVWICCPTSIRREWQLELGTRELLQLVMAVGNVSFLQPFMTAAREGPSPWHGHAGRRTMQWRNAWHLSEWAQAVAHVSTLKALGGFSYICTLCILCILQCLIYICTYVHYVYYVYYNA